jgi:hypothetical protein
MTSRLRRTSFDIEVDLVDRIVQVRIVGSMTKENTKILTSTALHLLHLYGLRNYLYDVTYADKHYSQVDSRAVWSHMAKAHKRMLAKLRIARVDTHGKPSEEALAEEIARSRGVSAFRAFNSKHRAHAWLASLLDEYER